MIVSASQPFCRLCGKPLRKETTTHWFAGACDGMSVGVPHAGEDPQTKAEAQRYLNEQIVSVRRGYRGLVVTTWDGESYRAEHRFFCTNRCAADAFTLNGRVIENIDSVCRPLTDMWSVEVTEGRERGARFGISGKALAPRTEGN